MRASDKILLEAAYACWAARDLEATLACFAEDVRFVIHLPADVAPFVGEVRGRAELGARLQMILNDFDFLEYRPDQITAEGIAFHSQVRFHYRHKITGLDYEGSMRHVWRIEGDHITRFEEFHDAKRVRAYFRLLARAMASPSTTADKSSSTGDA